MSQEYTPQEYEEQVQRRVEEAQARMRQQQSEDNYQAWHQANQE